VCVSDLPVPCAVAVSRDFRRQNTDGSLAEPLAFAAVAGALLLFCSLLATTKWHPTFYRKYYQEVQVQS
jgi:hypothetical protein